MPPEQILIGGTTAAMCLAGFCKQGWLLEQTRKGRWLVQTCGAGQAAWVLRVVCLLGFGFGVLLATGHINPLSSQRAAESSGRPMQRR